MDNYNRSSLWSIHLSSINSINFFFLLLFQFQKDKLVSIYFLFNHFQEIMNLAIKVQKTQKRLTTIKILLYVKMFMR